MTLRSTKGRRVAVAVGVVALAVSGLVASLALTGPAAAGAEEYDGGWPTELVADEGRAVVGPARAGDRRLIQLRSREVRGTEVDADGNGEFSPGDYSVFEERLFRHGDQVGRDSVRCMFNHRSFMCDGTLVRGSGNIEVAGAIFFGERGIHLAVTGGTGRYRDAAGTFTVREGSGNSSRFLIRLVD